MTLHRQPVPSEKLAVTFGYRGTKIARTGFGVDFLTRNGFDVVYVAQGAKTYFQGLSADAYMRAVAPVAGNREIVTYGASLGGYCAIYFGSHVDARIVALSPINHMHPIRGAVFDYRHTASLFDMPRSSIPPVIAYDPWHAEDADFVDGWARPAYPDAQIVHVPITGHKTARKLQDAGRLKSLVFDAFAGRDIAPEIRVFEDGSPDACLLAFRQAARAKDKAAMADTTAALIASMPSAQALKAAWKAAAQLGRRDLRIEILRVIETAGMQDQKHAQHILASARAAGLTAS